MILNLEKKTKSIWNSAIGLKFLIISLTFNMFILSFIRSVCIISEISYSSTLYISITCLALLCFIISLLNQEFFNVFINFLKSKVLRIYIVTLDSTIYNYLAKNYMLSGIVVLTYFFMLFMYLSGLIFGKDCFRPYIEIFPIFYVFRTVFVMPIIFIKILLEHPLFNEYTNNLYVSRIFVELGSSFGKAVSEFWSTPTGKGVAGTAAVMGAAEVIARVHQDNTKESLKQHERATRTNIAEAGSYKDGAMTPEICQRLDENRNAIADTRLELADPPFIRLYKDMTCKLTGGTTLREKSLLLHKEKYKLESSIRENDYHRMEKSFAAKGIETQQTSENPEIIIPSILEKLINFFI